jgi:mono/diheme cytochrome c family protein
VRAVRVGGWILVGLLGLVVLFLGILYGVSEWKLRQHHTVAASTFAVNPAASPERGKRQVQLRGCNGCHGPQLQGQAFTPVPLNTFVSPDIAGFARDSTDAQVERAIRHGLRPDGTGMYVMPSPSFYFIDDADLSDIIAYLRSIPPDANRQPETHFPLLARWFIVFGGFASSSAGNYHTAARFPSSNANPEAEGAYLAHSICSECHGLDLHGGPPDLADPTPPPDLAIVHAYSAEDFGKLLRGGVALGGRRLGILMSGVTAERTPHLSDAEVSALYAYLSHLGAKSGS